MEEEDLQRPPEAVAITEDGLLHMLTLREGTGEVPPKHARCLGEPSDAIDAEWRCRLPACCSRGKASHSPIALPPAAAAAAAASGAGPQLRHPRHAPLAATLLLQSTMSGG